MTSHEMSLMKSNMLIVINNSGLIGKRIEGEHIKTGKRLHVIKTEMHFRDNATVDFLVTASIGDGANVYSLLDVRLWV